MLAGPLAKVSTTSFVATQLQTAWQNIQSSWKNISPSTLAASKQHKEPTHTLFFSSLWSYTNQSRKPMTLSLLTRSQTPNQIFLLQFFGSLEQRQRRQTKCEMTNFDQANFAYMNKATKVPGVPTRLRENCHEGCVKKSMELC